VNRLGTPITRASNQASGSPRRAAGSRGLPAFGGPVGAPASVASPRAASVSHIHFRISRAAGRELVPVRVVAQNKQTDNNALEPTRSARFSSRGPCGSTQCCTDRRTDQRHHRASALRGRGSSSWLPGTNGPAWAAVVRPFSSLGLLSELAQPSSNIMSAGARPSRFHRQPRGSTSVIKRLVRSFTIGSSRLGGARPYNNALHLTKGGGAVASRPVVEAPFAGERECWAGTRGRGLTA
jgi:hypothetical protein